MFFPHKKPFRRCYFLTKRKRDREKIYLKNIMDFHVFSTPDYQKVISGML
jgi:hypothetical protein